MPAEIASCCRRRLPHGSQGEACLRAATGRLTAFFYGHPASLPPGRARAPCRGACAASRTATEPEVPGVGGAAGAWAACYPIRNGPNGAGIHVFGYGGPARVAPHSMRIVEPAAVWAHVSELPDREQPLLALSYYGNMTEIGERLGLSQMHASRLLSHALGYLRDCVLDPA